MYTFINSDKVTKKEKFLKWWHRNDWTKAHRPSIVTRIKTEWYYLRHKKNCLIVDGWLVKYYETKESYMNWGDDINVYMFELITRKKVIPAAKLLFLHKKYAFIGSVIPACIDRNTTVWGSGCMDFEQPIGKISSTGAIKAVRGPKTCEYLLKNGVECPEIYGDPALLLPKVYQPKDKTKKYKMTIIPHHHDWDKPEELKNYLHQYLPDAHVINMTDYKVWTDVIDEIVQSEIVYSSSLHGLITSDAYGIPNAFVELLYHHPKIDKYEDYYMSLQKIGSSKNRMIEPLKGDEMLLHKDELLNSFRPQKIDLQPLINACPLNLYIKNDEK